MLIRELDLEAFGKFSSRKISFKKGINVVYGDNESGKSTVHSFIRGMLYGFIKSGVKSSIYTTEHSRYLPWSNGAYIGRMTIIKDGESYIIERNFSKGSEYTKVFIEATGEEVTGRLRLGPSNKILQPGYEFLGMGSSIFSNSISIRQKGIDTDSSLADEIRERLVNAASGRDETVSVEKALKSLHQQIKDIGSRRASSSRYGLSALRVEELKLKLTELAGLRFRYSELLLEYRQLSIVHKDLSAELMSVNNTLRDLRLWKRKTLLQRAADLEAEINAIEVRIAELEVFRNANEAQLETARKISSDIELSRLRISGLDEQCGTLQERASKLFSKNIDEIEPLDSLFVSGYRFNQLEASIGTDTRETVEKSIAASNKSKKRSRVIAIILGAAYLGGLGYFLTYKEYVAASILQIILLGAVHQAFYSSIANKASQAFSRKLDLIVQTEHILSEFGKSTSSEFRNAFERAKMERVRLEENQLLKVELQSSISIIEERRREELELLDLMEAELSKILIHENVESIDSMKESVVKKNLLKDIEIQYEFKNRERNQIYEITSSDGLMKNLEELSSMNKPETILNEQELVVLSTRLESEAEDAAYRIKAFEGRISAYDERLALETEYEEEKCLIEAELRSLDDERAALELAADRIERLSGEIHREFAPEINRRIGAVLSRITDGCYNVARVDQNLSTRIINRHEGKLLTVDNISGGTTDQLYLALRMGLLNDLVAEDAPLFLDESFAQYDDSRLKGALKYLSEESMKRQIIIFTCHKRELELLQEIGAPYTMINLSIN